MTKAKSKRKRETIKCFECKKKIGYKEGTHYYVPDGTIQSSNGEKLLTFCNQRCYRKWDKLI